MTNLYSPVFFGTFLQVFFLFVIIYLLGHTLLSFFRTKPDNNSVSLFLKLFVGIISGVTLYALVKTHLCTIFLITLVIGGYFAFKTEKNSLKEIKQKLFNVEYKQFLCLIILLFGFYTLLYYQYYIPTNGGLFGDFHFYSNVAYMLNTTGVETTNMDWTLSSSPSPYHYFEVWFIALSSFIFSNTTLLSYYLFFVPILALIVFQGALSIACLVLDDKNRYTYLLCCILGLLFLIIQNVDIPFVDKLFLRKYFGVGCWVYNMKLSIVFILFQAIIIALIKKEYQIAFVLNLLFVPLYSPLAPAILSGLFLLLSYLALKKQFISKHYWLYGATLAAIVIFYGLFYLLQKNNIPSDGQNTFLITSELLPNVFKAIRVFVKLIFFCVLPAAVLFFMLFSLYKKKVDFKGLIDNSFICLSIYIAGALFILMLFIPVYLLFDHDAFQLLDNFVAPVFVCVCFWVILKFVNVVINYKMLFGLCIAIFYVGLFFNNPSVALYMKIENSLEIDTDNEYFENISQKIKESPKYKFAYFRNYENKDLMEIKPFLFMPDNRIAHFTSDYIPLCLSVFELPDDTDTRYGDKNNFAFYRFAKNKDNLTGKMLSFIEENNIKFIIIEQNAVYPQEIIQKSDTVFENIKNKNKFVVLK